MLSAGLLCQVNQYYVNIASQLKHVFSISSWKFQAHLMTFLLQLLHATSREELCGANPKTVKKKEASSFCNNTDMLRASKQVRESVVLMLSKWC